MMQLTNKHVFQPANCTYKRTYIAGQLWPGHKRSSRRGRSRSSRRRRRRRRCQESRSVSLRQTFRYYLPSVIAFPLCLRSCRDNSTEVRFPEIERCAFRI